MTFLVERPTPGKRGEGDGLATYRGAQRAMREALPFEVEVEDEMCPRIDYSSSCACRAVFRLTADSVERLRKKRMLRKESAYVGALPCICACMGRKL